MTHLRTAVIDALTRNNGMTRELAVAMYDLIDCLEHTCDPGGMKYLARKKFGKRMRDREIFEKACRANVKAMAAQENLTPRRIQQIIERERKALRGVTVD